MLIAHRDELLRRLPDDARLLDVGGWAAPMERADAVIDLMPFETRGLYGPSDPARERFTAETWVQRDICDREPWPFADDEFDFVVCSHTLEDIRDPVWVCEEIRRVGRAGYLEFPSRLEEHCHAIDGPWTGWNHHRWLCEADREAGAVTFTFKYAMLEMEQFRFEKWFWEGLSEEQRRDWLWWEQSFEVAERVHMDPTALFQEMDAFVRAHRDLVAAPRRRALRRRLDS